MAKVKTVAGILDVPAGKEITVEDGKQKGFKDGDKIVTFKKDDVVDFEFSYPKEHTKVKHVEEGTKIKLHPLDAAIAEKQGKGKIIKK